MVVGPLRRCGGCGGCSYRLVVDRIAPGATFFGGWICALVRLTFSRAAAEANRIWGGVHV